MRRGGKSEGPDDQAVDEAQIIVVPGSSDDDTTPEKAGGHKTREAQLAAAPAFSGNGTTPEEAGDQRFIEAQRPCVPVPSGPKDNELPEEVRGHPVDEAHCILAPASSGPKDDELPEGAGDQFSAEDHLSVVPALSGNGTISEGLGDLKSPEAQVDRVPSLSDICGIIQDLQVRRRFCIRQQVRLNNSLGALARWQLGWSLALPEKERDAIKRKASKMVKDMRVGDVTDPEMELLWPYLVDIDSALEPFTTRRKAIQKDMEKYARLTPGMPVVDEIEGIGPLGLAVIIGEAGDLWNYPNLAKLWKRLGWAPPDEYDKGEKSEGRKIPRRRKGDVWGVIVPQIIKRQIRVVMEGDEKTDERTALGPEGQLYLDRKAAYFARFTKEGGKAPKAHADKLACRVMLKDILKRVWVAWHDAPPALVEDGSPPEGAGDQTASEAQRGHVPVPSDDDTT